eukprot:Nk52_evm55s226 gene=Nk52_evmTU55s226
MGSGASKVTPGGAADSEALKKAREKEDKLTKKIKQLEKEVKSKSEGSSKESQALEVAVKAKDKEIDSLKAKIRSLEKKLASFTKGHEIISHNNKNLNLLGNEDMEEVGPRTAIFNEGEASKKEQVAHKDEDFIKTSKDMEIIENSLQDSIVSLLIQDDDQKEAIIGAMYKVEVASGTHVITEGDNDDIFYIITEGDFEIWATTEAGVQEYILTRGPGSSFGELALIYYCLRTATVKAKTDGILWAIDRHTFRALLKTTTKKRIEQNKHFLENIPILRELKDEQITKLAGTLEIVNYEDGDFIIRQGEEGDQFFIIREGEVRVTTSTPGSDEVQVGSLKYGDFFGEMALLGNTRRAANVIACSPNGVVCLAMAKVHFDNLLGELKEIKTTSVKRESEIRKIASSSNVDIEKKVKKEKVVKTGSHWRSDIKLGDLKDVSILGYGAFGKVKLVKTGNDEMFAMKCLKMSKVMQMGQKEHVINEKLVLCQVEHPFVLHLYNAYKDATTLYMLIEPCLGGELFTLLRKKRRFNKVWAQFYAGSVLLVLEHLHKLDIIYRDLKPENLLLDTEGYLKVVDFGFAKVVPPDTKTYTLCGTPDYLAPEILQNAGHDKAVDWWAFGVYIFEMLAGYAPFASKDPIQIYKKILSGSYEFPQNFSKNATDLIKKLLNPVQNKRFGNLMGGADDIRYHKWFQGFDFDELINRKMKVPHVPEPKNFSDPNNFDNHPLARLHKEDDKDTTDYTSLFQDF